MGLWSCKKGCKAEGDSSSSDKSLCPAFVVKVAMAAFTGRYSLCRFSTGLIKNWRDDRSHKVGFNRFALWVYP